MPGVITVVQFKCERMLSVNELIMLRVVLKRAIELYQQADKGHQPQKTQVHMR